MSHTGWLCTQGDYALDLHIELGNYAIFWNTRRSWWFTRFRCATNDHKQRISICIWIRVSVSAATHTSRYGYGLSTISKSKQKVCIWNNKSDSDLPHVPRLSLAYRHLYQIRWDMLREWEREREGGRGRWVRREVDSEIADRTWLRLEPEGQADIKRQLEVPPESTPCAALSLSLSASLSLSHWISRRANCNCI